MITNVALGSPAHNAGLLQGDRILSVSAADKLARTNVKGILADELNGLIRQTHAAAKAGGKMIIRVERLGGKGVQELEKELAVTSKTASNDTGMDGLKGNNCVFQHRMCLCVNVVTMECNCIFYICTFLNRYAFPSIFTVPISLHTHTNLLDCITERTTTPSFFLNFFSTLLTSLCRLLR